MVVSWAAVLAGSITCLAAGIFILLCIIAAFTESTKSNNDYFFIPFFAVLSLFLGAGGLAWLRSGLQRLRRYRRHTPSESTESLPTLLPLKDRVQGWALLVTGAAIFTVWGAVGIFGLVKYGTPILTNGNVPNWLRWMGDDVRAAWPIVHDHPYLEMLWWIGEHTIIILLGCLMFRRGIRTLWPYRFKDRRKSSSVSAVDRPPSLVLAFVKGLCGCLALNAAALGFFAMRNCATAWHGYVPSWLTGTIVSYRLSDSCHAISQKIDWGGFSFAVFFASLLVLSIAWLRKGFLESRAALSHRRVAGTGSGFQLAMVAAGCAILIAGSLSFWMHIGAQSGEQEEKTERHQDRGAVMNPQVAAPWVGAAVGDKATILHTDDGGTTWETQNSSTGSFYSVSFPTRQSGWAVSARGIIWHTNDSGKTWPIEASGTTEDLTGVVLVGPEIGWVVGDDGTIIHTEDGGQTWKAQKSGTAENLITAIFVSRQSGWVVGAGGTILHTEDGGSSWIAQNSGIVRELIGVSFPTASSGWAVGGRGTILHTDDGGRTWKSQASGIRSDAMSVAFANAQSGWVVGRGGVILHTADGGKTWETQASGTRVDLIEVKFVTPQSGWIVGKNGTILHTEDGGSTWWEQKSGTDAELESVSIVLPYGVIGMELEDQPSPAGAHARVAGTVVLVMSVVPGGPAEKAALKKGDIIVALNGNPVKNTNEFVAGIFALKPGTDAKVAYIRGGRDETADVIVGDGSKPFAGPAPR
jgi:photosystem II stability/assembly factor-like uncharacterized protein